MPRHLMPMFNIANIHISALSQRTRRLPPTAPRQQLPEKLQQRTLHFSLNSSK